MHICREEDFTSFMTFPVWVKTEVDSLFSLQVLSVCNPNDPM